MEFLLIYISIGMIRKLLTLAAHVLKIAMISKEFDICSGW